MKLRSAKSRNLSDSTPFVLGLAAVSLSLLAGCDEPEPTSYLIPKEDRSVQLPSGAPNAAPSTGPEVAQAAGASGNPATNNSGMAVLPGMAEAANEAGGLGYTVPSGWVEVAPSGIRKANFFTSEGPEKAEMTVLVFPGDVGGRLANINRWHQQIGLDPVTSEALPEFVQSYEISDHRGLYIRLQGDEKSILGGLLPFHGFTWFFKLQGPTETVLENEEALQAFLGSVQIEDNHAH